MKTKNAFAFRDFDAKRILQRPFFKAFNFDDTKTDAEILQSLSLSDDDSLPTIESKHETLNAIFDSLSRLRVLIGNVHCKRLSCYRRKLTKKVNSVEDGALKKLLEERHQREQSFAFTYLLEINDDIAELMKTVENQWRALETKLQEVYRENFAERLKQARIKANLSRKQLGDTINISPNGYGQYESARREPSLTSLIRIARTLNVSTDWLVGVAP